MSNLEGRRYSSYVVVKGNCPICGKKLGEKDNIFLCQECYQKDLEYRKKKEKEKNGPLAQSVRAVDS